MSRCHLSRFSLHRHFAALVDVEALGGGLGGEAAAVEGVPGGGSGRMCGGVGCVVQVAYVRFVGVAEVEAEGAHVAVGGADGEAVLQLEVGAAGADGDYAVGVVEGVVGSEVEDVLFVVVGFSGVMAYEPDGFVSAAGCALEAFDGDADKCGAGDVVA